jgi:hypothetical protein
MLVMPSSNGCRSPASPCRLHSGRASRQRTPCWASDPSPGMGTWPPPISPPSAMGWWGARHGRVVTTAVRRPVRPAPRGMRGCRWPRPGSDGAGSSSGVGPAWISPPRGPQEQDVMVRIPEPSHRWALEVVAPLYASPAAATPARGSSRPATPMPSVAGGARRPGSGCRMPRPPRREPPVLRRPPAPRPPHCGGVVPRHASAPPVGSEPLPLLRVSVASSTRFGPFADRSCVTTNASHSRHAAASIGADLFS